MLPEVKYIANCDDARNDSIIKQALSVIRPKLVDGAVDFLDLQNREMMPFWRYFMMTEVFEAQDTFKYIYVGTSIVAAYGRDFTNTYWNDNCTKELAAHNKGARYNSVNNREILYACGRSLSDNSLFLDWRIVYIPMVKQGRDNFCLNVHVHTLRDGRVV